VKYSSIGAYRKYMITCLLETEESGMVVSLKGLLAFVRFMYVVLHAARIGHWRFPHSSSSALVTAPIQETPGKSSES